MYSSLYKPLNNMSYDTYQKISIGFDLSGLALFISFGFFCNFYALLALIPIEFVTSYFANSEAAYNTKEIKELEALFKIFLNNYHELNRIFNLKHPVEIMFLYTYLMKNGYLSTSKKHECIDCPKDHDILYKYAVFTGESVCRHDAALLKEILKNEGISSSILYNYMTSLRLNFEKLKKLDELKEQTMSYLEKKNDECLGQLLMRINQYLAEGKLTNDDVLSLKEFHRFKTNHVITMANYNGRNYYMDPTNNCILRKAIIDKHLILEDGFYAYIPNTGFRQNEKYKLQRDNRHDAREFLNGEDITIDEEQSLRNKIEKLYGNNLDILEAFYRENAELYKDISNNVIKMRTRMIL